MKIMKSVRVCEDRMFGGRKKGFTMSLILKEIIDGWVKNVVNDWDFVLIISGGGQVRVGKSVLAMQIAYYWKDRMKKVHNIDVPFNVKENIVFHGTELIKKGNFLGTTYKYSPLIFDEAGADLEGLKVMRNTTQAVKDFLRECGQYNLFTILVIPEYFDLPIGIALTRSDALLDVFTITDKDGMFVRGYFNSYNREGKKWLYLNGKKTRDYSCQKQDYWGRYYNNYTIDEGEYKMAKVEALKTREKTKSLDKFQEQRNLMFKFCADHGYTKTEISNYLRDNGISLTRAGVSMAITSVSAPIVTNTMYKNEDDGGGEDDSGGSNENKKN